MAVVAKRGVGMDLLHEAGEIAGGVVLADGFVEWDESVFNGARAFDGKKSVDGTLAGGEAVGLNFLEGGDVGFGSPDGRLRNGDSLRRQERGEDEWKTEEDCQACGEHHERTSRRIVRAEWDDSLDV